VKTEDHYYVHVPKHKQVRFFFFGGGGGGGEEREEYLQNFLITERDVEG
jgi:hypothetical protein